MNPSEFPRTRKLHQFGEVSSCRLCSLRLLTIGARIVFRRTARALRWPSLWHPQRNRLVAYLASLAIRGSFFEYSNMLSQLIVASKGRCNQGFRSAGEVPKRLQVFRSQVLLRRMDLAHFSLDVPCFAL